MAMTWADLKAELVDLGFEEDDITNEYGRIMLSFHKELMARGWTTRTDYLTGAVPHYLVCIMPEFIRKLVYRRLH